MTDTHYEVNKQLFRFVMLAVLVIIIEVLVFVTINQHNSIIDLQNEVDGVRQYASNAVGDFNEIHKGVWERLDTLESQK